MVTFTDACEMASRHFGMHTTTSCISRAWFYGDEWRFEPAIKVGARRRRQERISINRSNGKIDHASPVDVGEEITNRIPWQYQPRLRTAYAEYVESAGRSDKTNVSDSKAPSLEEWTRIA